MALLEDYSRDNHPVAPKEIYGENFGWFGLEVNYLEIIAYLYSDLVGFQR